MNRARVAVVTGGNRGIGFEICRQLAGLGMRVVLTARNPDAARERAAALSPTGEVLPFPLDVTSTESVARLAEYVESQLGGADVLVNNAAIFPAEDHAHGSLTLPLGAVRTTFETNVFGPWALTQALVPGMQRRGYGRIVNMSSGLGGMSEMAGGFAGYRLSKAALNALTIILASDLRDGDVLVNALYPGWVQTDMGGPLAPRTPAQGADTAIYLATLPTGGPTGKLFRDREEVPW
ncbi:MAG TPA: SDR family oxidoreductase [Thermoanaerobaculia bacterium]|nr:SDR family oxidoreductase [Thermoanaerobaculia bacterium]